MNFWCFIRALWRTSITQRQDGTLRSATPLCNNSKLFPIFVPISLTFIGGDDHVDSSILMRKAFGWRVSSRVASRGKRPERGVNSELFSGTCFLICRCSRCSLRPSKTTLSVWFILYLIRCVLTENHSELKDSGKWILMLCGWGFSSSVHWHASFLCSYVPPFMVVIE